MRRALAGAHMIFAIRGQTRRTHWGLGAPQSMQRLFSFVFAISPSFDRVSGSTSHILLILGELPVCWRKRVAEVLRYGERCRSGCASVEKWRPDWSVRMRCVWSAVCSISSLYGA